MKGALLGVGDETERRGSGRTSGASRRVPAWKEGERRGWGEGGEIKNYAREEECERDEEEEDQQTTKKTRSDARRGIDEGETLKRGRRRRREGGGPRTRAHVLPCHAKRSRGA